jgi:hypothetical protein
VGKLWQFPLDLLVNILRRKAKALGSGRGEVLGSGMSCGCAAGKVLAKAKADSTRALKTRQLRRPTKRVATPAELFNEEVYKNARSNLDERFWRLQFGVSPASSDSSVVRGVVNASARNVVQSTLRRFIRLSQRGVQVFVHDVRFRKIYLPGRWAPSLYNVQLKEYSNREVKATSCSIGRISPDILGGCWRKYENYLSRDDVIV